MSRRLTLALVALLAAVAGALALAAGGGAQVDVRDGPAAGAYRVDAIFDTAKGIVPGQTGEDRRRPGRGRSRTSA